MILSFIMITSCYGLILEVDQENNIYDYYNSENGNFGLMDLVGSVNTNKTFSNVTYDYDIKYEYTSINEDFFYVIENYYENETITFMYHGDLTRDSNLYIQEVNLNEVGQYYFKFSPSVSDEPASIYINVESNHVFKIEYVELKPKGFNSLIGGFVGGFMDIVEINVSFWVILWYTILFIIITSFTIGIFVFGFWILKRAKTLREKGFNGEG